MAENQDKATEEEKQVRLMLVTKTETRLKPTCLARAYGMNEGSDYQVKLVVPERVIYDCYKSLLGEKEGCSKA